MLSIIYSIAFIWSYIFYLVPAWSYLGLTYKDRGLFHLFQTLIFCSFPAFWMPQSIIRSSMIIYLILYVMTYIPMVIGVNLAENFSISQTYYFNFILILSFYLVGIGYKFRLYYFKRPYLELRLFWSIVFLLTIVLLIYTLYVFKNHLKFIGIFSENLYDIRFSGREIEAESMTVGYFILFLANSLLPFIFAFGIIKKQYFLIIFSSICQILLYMTMANKAFVLLPIFMLFIYILYIKFKRFEIAFISIITFLLIFLSFTQIDYNDELKLFFLPLSSLFVTRTLATSTFNSIYYYDFFLNNPYTYFSHLNFLRKIINYPYDDELGIIVASHFSDIDKYNANATFFITDGIAALGIFGMPIIALACSALFYLLDSITKKHNRALIILIFSSFTINLMNASLFTSFLSGGIFLTILIIIFLNPSSSYSK
jgi:hypothetical protein